jgi:hypothetical protein
MISKVPSGAAAFGGYYEYVYVKNLLTSIWENKCVICGLEFEDKNDITIEHLIPRGKNGTNDMENLSVAHYNCNHSRANKSLIWAMKNISYISKKPYQYYRPYVKE